jgi:twinkle protein
MARYDDGGATCHTAGCGYWEGKTGTGTIASPQTNINVRPVEMEGTVQAIPDRGISQATCAKYGVTVEIHKGAITKHHYPDYDKQTGQIVGTKVRVCATKKFQRTGTKDTAGLFGQNTCRGKGKYITITEGELDALAVSEMFDNKWDVVSLNDGAASAKRSIQRELEFLEGYDNIVLCFDNDKAGKQAVEDVKDLFSPGKLKIVTLPAKDAGAMLVERKVKAFTEAWWDAKSYTPSGIVRVSETWKDVLTYRDTPMTPYPYEGLNSLLLGQRSKEIVVWAADTGIGKSQTMREIQSHIIETTTDNVGCLMLEESVAKTTLGWMSFAAGRPLHKELGSLSDEQLRKYWEIASRGDRLVLLDHKGWQNDLETLKQRIRYMAKSLNCRWIILDHLHMALSSIAGASGDWGGIDELMTDLVSIVHECDVGLHLVSHISEERSLRGSKGIAKAADAVIFLERDKHHEDPEIANTTTVIVDKNRFCGDTGIACYLKYDKYTGRMTETSKPEESFPDEF